MAENIDLNLNLNTNNADNSLNGLTQKLSDLKSKLGNVAVGSSEFNKLKQQIVETDTKLKNLNASIEGVSTEKLVGEIGKFAGGMTQAFAGMSLLIGKNNKSLEEMQKSLSNAIGIVMAVKGAMDAFTAATNLAKVAQMALNTATKANPWGLVLAGIAAIVVSLDVYLAKMRGVNKENEEFRKINLEVAKSVEVEKNKIDVLVRTASNMEVSYTNRKKAIEELNKIAPEYLGNITLETVGTSEAEAAINSYIESLSRKVEAQQLSMQMEELTKKQLELEAETWDDLSMWQQLYYTGLELINKEGKTRLDIWSDEQMTKITENYSKILHIQNELIRLQMETPVEPVVPEKTPAKTTVKKQEREEEKQFRADMLKALNLETEQYEEMDWFLARIAEKWSDLVKRTNDTEKGTKFFNFWIEDIEMVEKSLTMLQDSLNRLLDVETFGAISSEVTNLLGGIINGWKNMADNWNQINNEIASEAIKKSDGVLLKVSQIAQFVAANIQNVFMVLQQNIQKTLESALEKSSQTFEKQNKMVQESYDEGVINKAQYEKAIAEIERKKAEDEKKIRRDAWEKEHKLALTNAIIQGATATLAAYSSGAAYPFFGTATGAIFAALAAAVAAVQIGIISSQKSPYAKGGILRGASHAQGGIQYAVGGNVVELEGGEAVINKRSMAIPEYRSMASAINVAGGGVPFANTTQPLISDETIERIVSRIAAIPVIVSENDITKTQRKVSVTQSRSKF